MVHGSTGPRGSKALAGRTAKKTRLPLFSALFRVDRKGPAILTNANGTRPTAVSALSRVDRKGPGILTSAKGTRPTAVLALFRVDLVSVPTVEVRPQS